MSPSLHSPRLFTALFLLGASGSVWCFYNHLCICGHLAHMAESNSGADPVLHSLFDMAWVTCFGFSIFVAFAGRLRYRWWTLLTPVFLYYRFFLGSMGGQFRIPI